MTTIHFIRHGQSTWNAEQRIQGSSNPELSELGRSQAIALQGKLPAFDRVFCSDLTRTQQTAELILEGTGHQVEYQSALREIHLGPWEGMLLCSTTKPRTQSHQRYRRAMPKPNGIGCEPWGIVKISAD